MGAMSLTRRTCATLVSALVVALAAALVVWGLWPRAEPDDQPSPTSPAPSTQAASARPAAVTATPFLDHSTVLWKAYQQAASAQDRTLFYQLAGTPTATWFDGDEDTSRLADLLQRAAAAHAVASIVLYDIPGRDCNSHSRGGSQTGEQYKAWIRAVSRTIGTRQVVAVLEPDAISYCGSAAVRAARAPLLRYAAQTLAAGNPNAAVYLHAGDGTLGLADAAQAVQQAGIQYLRGFAVDVAAHTPTRQAELWGEQFVAELARRGISNMHYVVDTGRSGAAVGPNKGASFQACNNPTAALGPRPTTRTGAEHDDAWLWVKPAGLSDGVCRPGQPASGVFYPALARTVVQRSLQLGTVAELTP